MNAHRNSLRLAVLALSAAAALAAPAQPLAAQGGPQAHRAGAAGSAPTSLLEPARTMLRHLMGRWRFEVRFAGNFDGPPDASGTRIVDTLFGDLRLQWTEAHDDSPLRGQGIIGFDRQTGRFYSSAVLSAGSGMEFLAGTVSRIEPVITFAPVASDSLGTQRAMASFTWTMVDPDHFVWAPLDRGWRAVFTRER